MLTDYYKTPWRRLQTDGSPTIGEIVAASPSARTIGFAVGTGAALGNSQVGGLTASCGAWGSAVSAVSKIEMRGSRVWAVLARAVLDNLPGPQGPQTIPGTPGSVIPGTPAQTRSINVPLGDQENAPRGQVRGAAVQNPFSVAASLFISGTADDYVTINGRRVGSVSSNYSTINVEMTVGAGESIQWALHNPSGGFAGGNLNFVFTIPGTPDTIMPGTPDTFLPAETGAEAAARNAPAAIPYLNIAMVAGTLFPWFPTAEAFAMAGQWMRRESWTDVERRMRFERGGGTEDVVAVTLATGRVNPIPQTVSEFGLAEYLAENWTFYQTPSEDIFLDVTDIAFSALLGGGVGFHFVVEQSSAEPPPEPSPAPPSEPPAPQTGDFVRMMRNGVEQWAPVAPFACPV